MHIVYCGMWPYSTYFAACSTFYIELGFQSKQNNETPAAYNSRNNQKQI